MGESPSTVICKVCKTENSKFRMKCSDCEQYLGKPPKKGNQRSKQSTGKAKYKRPKLTCSGNKQKYTFQEVKLAQKRVFKNRNAAMQYYRCSDCKAYHLTKARG
ncbi:MAG: hypothetical protein O3B67_00095 [archaeon]|nr:hypothetical protein [archaeon]